MPRIHPTAVVETGAEIADDVAVGPFCLVGPHVVLGQGTVLHAHVAIAGHTQIGARAKIFPFACVGYDPQDLKYRGEDNALVIGADAIIRENVTVNPGTEGGGGVTRIGDGVVLLAGSHVAHDCQIGDGVILVNNVLLAGHCSVGDHAILGGGSAVHQYVRIGAHAFLGGLSGLENDLIPFGMAVGNRAQLSGLNIVGLKRRGVEREAIQRLRQAYRVLFAQEGTLRGRVEDVAAAFGSDALVATVVAFIADGGERSICTPSRHESVEP